MERRVKTGLAGKVLKGDLQAAARLISLIEDRSPQAFVELDRLYPGYGRAHVVGVTGPPGVGKSTLVDGLIGNFRGQDSTVGVIAIDPSSTITGGALLGDRLRMQRHGADPRVFIRSLATRGWAGGLARAAIGTVLVMAPGAGDEVQAMKAGIIEAADVFVVNKADMEGADRLKADLDSVLEMACPGPTDWRPPVILAEAIREKGIAELAVAIKQHRESLADGGGLAGRRRERVRLELLGMVEGAVRDGITELENDGRLGKVVENLLEGKTTPRRAALEILGSLNVVFGDLTRDGGGNGP